MTSGAALSVGEALADAKERLDAAGVPDPRREASALMAVVLRTDRGGVAARRTDRLELPAAERFEALVEKRARRIPLQYLEGEADFRGLTLTVTPDVLIPRPETEDLVDAVLHAGLPADARVADLGTGSGCIAVSLAAERPGWRVTAIDISPAALDIARLNAVRCGVADRITLLAGDFTRLDAKGVGRCSAVVSNPPYVSQSEWEGLEPEVRIHEPKQALVPGPTGDEAYAALVPVAAAMLEDGGLLALELGWKSEPSVRAFIAGSGFHDVAVRPDRQGIARVLTARRRRA